MKAVIFIFLLLISSICFGDVAVVPCEWVNHITQRGGGFINSYSVAENVIVRKTSYKKCEDGQDWESCVGPSSIFPRIMATRLLNPSETFYFNSDSEGSCASTVTDGGRLVVGFVRFGDLDFDHHDVPRVFGDIMGNNRLGILLVVIR